MTLIEVYGLTPDQVGEIQENLKKNRREYLLIVHGDAEAFNQKGDPVPVIKVTYTMYVGEGMEYDRDNEIPYGIFPNNLRKHIVELKIPALYRKQTEEEKAEQQEIGHLNGLW